MRLPNALRGALFACAAVFAMAPGLAWAQSTSTSLAVKDANGNTQATAAQSQGGTLYPDHLCVGEDGGANVRPCLVDGSGKLVISNLPASVDTNAGAAGGSTIRTEPSNTAAVDGGFATAANQTPNSASAVAIAPVSSSALEACHVLKASAGNLYALAVTIQATSGVVLAFNATSAPADGAVTPVWSMPVLSNGAFGGASWEWRAPLRFSTGIAVCFSSATTPFTKTASATALISGAVE